MLRGVFLMICLCYVAVVLPQNSSAVTATLKDERTHSAVPGVEISLQPGGMRTFSDSNGRFHFSGIQSGAYELQIKLPGYKEVSVPIILKKGNALNLGVISMSRSQGKDLDVDLVNNGIEGLSGTGDMLSDFSFLNAEQDLYEKRSAFNFGNAFYRIRGYDSRYRRVLLNGIPIHDIQNGRAPFMIWGGLNDMFRNREFARGLEGVSPSFGGIGGNLNLHLEPGSNREGARFSSSASNRGYHGRLMFTYNSGYLNNKWAFSMSASRRWAEQGYVDGTLYDAYSLFGAVQLRLGQHGSLVFNAIYAPQRRGLRSAITAEVESLAGSRYNPNWGYFQEEIRNSRTRKIQRPLFLLNYLHKSDSWNWQLGVLQTVGSVSNGRLGYYNAPNPFPDYYRYLPSWQFNGGLVSFDNAWEIRSNFTEDPQLRWEELYRMNSGAINEGRARYLLYDDVSSGSTTTAAFNADLSVGALGRLQLGVYGLLDQNSNFAVIKDLLGARFHLDEDPFSGTLNDIDSDGIKLKGDRFGYHYQIRTLKSEAFIRYLHRLKRGHVFLSYGAGYLNTVRTGRFQNERYPNASKGEGEPLMISGHSLKAGGELKLSGRQRFTLAAGWINRLPDINSLFLNPRENGSVRDDPKPESILTTDLNYRMDLPDLRIRGSAYYTVFTGLSETSFYYLEGGLGDAFVQEFSGGMGKQHYGAELSLQYDLTPELKVDMVAAKGVHVYTANPDLTLNFNTVNEESVIDPGGVADLGEADLKGYRVASGPQTAIAVGAEYRSPKYWWMGMTASYLDNNYLGISKVRRTDSFFIDPETGEEVYGIDPVVSSSLLKQERLPPIYYLDLTGGKSWLVGPSYISFFLSVNNVFNAVYRTGGYEQHRKANYTDLYDDSLSGMPSFGPKYWYGNGRTYFVNLAVNF